MIPYSLTEFSTNKLPNISVRYEELYELQGRPKIGSKSALTDIDLAQINKQYGCYVPNSNPDKLKVWVLQAGPFSDPAHYYDCVTAHDSDTNKEILYNNIHHRSRMGYNIEFEPTASDTEIHLFDIEIK